MRHRAAAAGRSRAAKRASARAKVRCRLGLFAAADLLGFGFVRGVPIHLYLEKLDPDILKGLALSADNSPHPADVCVRIQTNREACSYGLDQILS